MVTSMRDKGNVSVIIATIFVGSNSFLLKTGTVLIPELPLVSLGLLLAGFATFALDILFKKWKMFLYGRKYILEFLWIGGVGTAIPFAMFVYGISLSSVSNVFLVQTEFVYSILLSFFFK
jgi:drug/metabolite transporter (DMT)-like permease